MLRHPALLIAAAAILCLSPAPTYAVVIIGNLGAADAGTGGTVGDIPGNPAFQEYAVSFTMPANDFTIDNILLRLADPSVLDGTPDITLRADAAGLPGAQLATFNAPAPALSGATQTHIFTPVGAITLNANAAYWIHVGHVGPTGSYAWVDSAPSTNPSGLATFGQYRVSSDDGSTFPTVSPNRLKFEVNATLVPEPSAALLLPLAILVPLLRHHRRR
ncbi:MAG: choice-of-anchor R domain-containing protein [Verrucomicrobiota bacterium]